ncbi:MAG TPA: hypothetical protein VM686_23410 [Polyangiaceae bacterium]|nr:hypothetical protein [Polyangiaceae bacterium]
MEPMITQRRREEVGYQPGMPESSGPEFPESEKRRLSRTSDDEALLSSDPPSPQKIEELPTEPHHALPTNPDLDWDAPTIPDGRTLDSWDIDERG